MASVFPGALDTFATNKTNATLNNNDHPNHHNDLADAVNKVEAELGINPSGAAATVKARLDAVDTTLANLPPSGAKELPIELLNPDQVSDIGNAYPTVVNLTSWQMSAWAMLNASASIFGNVKIPSNLPPPANARIYLEMCSAITTGSVSMTVGVSRVGSTGSFNPGSLTTASANFVAPGTAYQRYMVTVQPTWTPAAGEMIPVKISRASGGVAGIIYVVKALIEVIA